MALYCYLEWLLKWLVKKVFAMPFAIAIGVERRSGNGQYCRENQRGRNCSGNQAEESGKRCREFSEEPL